MTCRVEVTLQSSDRGGVAVATSALDQIDGLEAQLSIFRESSEISFLNREASDRAVVVEPALFDLLSLCKRLYEETAGAFDVTVGPLTRCWGFLRSLFKNTRITEGTKFQLRFGLLNAFNHPWLLSGAAIQMNPTASNFGALTAGTQANYPRRVQVMLKFIF